MDLSKCDRDGATIFLMPVKESFVLHRNPGNWLNESIPR